METNSTNPSLPATALSRFLRGLGSTSLAQIIAAANSVLLVPLFLNAWGADGYGKWLTLTALVAYLTLVDLGGQSFIGNLLAMEYVRGNEGKFRERLSEGVSLFALIALSVFCLLLIVLSLPGLSIPGHDTPLSLDERLVLLFMGAAFLLSIPGGVYVTAYRATGLFARGTMVGNTLRLIVLGVFVAVLVAKVAPMIYAAVYLASGIMGTIVIIYDIYRQIPATRRIRLSLAAARAGRIHLAGSLHFWLLAVANGLKQHGVIIVLGATVSPALVATYATHRIISGLVGYVSPLLRDPLWPELTFLHAQGRKNDLVRGILLAVKVTVLLSGGAAVFLWIFGPVIYPVWTGRELEIIPILLALFLIQALLASGWNTCGWALLASNQHRRLSYATLSNAVVTIVIAVILAPRFGILGVAFAALAGDLSCGATIFPWLVSHTLRFSVKKIYKAILRPLFAILPAGIILFVSASFLQGPLHLLVMAVIGVVLIYPTTRLAIGKGEDVKWALEKFKGLWRSRAQASKKSA